MLKSDNFSLERNVILTVSGYKTLQYRLHPYKFPDTLQYTLIFTYTDHLPHPYYPPQRSKYTPVQTQPNTSLPITQISPILSTPPPCTATYPNYSLTHPYLFKYITTHSHFPTPLHSIPNTLLYPDMPK